MSTARMVNTRFWDDDYGSNLDPIEKLLFLYFLTNTSTNICGIYEIPLKKIAVDTGIDKEMVVKIISRFTNDGKVFYHNGWLCMKNFIKNQNQKSHLVIIGIKNELAKVPSDIMQVFIGYGYPIVSNLIKSNSIKSKEGIATLPDWLDKKVWGEWVEFRKEKKKTLTQRGIELQILQILSKDIPNHKTIIENSIRNGWTGLFPLKEEPKKYNGPPERKYKAEPPQEKFTPDQEEARKRGLAMLRDTFTLKK